MKLRILLVITVLFTLGFASSSFARKPAVEEFVGVETENYRPTTEGTEVLFNFGNHINSHEKQSRQNQTSSAWFATSVLVAFILLPFLMWIGISNSLKKETEVKNSSQDNNQDESVAELGNVKHLSDYKADTVKDDIKKAS